MSAPVITVKVIAAAAGSSFSDLEDADAVGDYLVELDPTLPEKEWASAALDAFHANVPISNLDEMDVSVRTMAGEELQESHDHESYSLRDRATFLGRSDGTQDDPGVLQSPG